MAFEFTDTALEIRLICASLARSQGRAYETLASSPPSIGSSDDNMVDGGIEMEAPACRCGLLDEVEVGLVAEFDPAALHADGRIVNTSPSVAADPRTGPVICLLVEAGS